MPRTTAENLGSNIVGSPTNSFLLLPFKHDLGRQPEVPNFNFHLVIEKQIPQLQVSVDHLLRVHILSRIHDLSEVVLCLHITESLPSLYHVIQREVLADLQHDVDVLRVFKIRLEVHYSIMPH